MKEDLFTHEVELKKLSPKKRRRIKFKKRLLRHLYYEGPLSNPELCKLSGISIPTGHSILDDLLEEGYVHKYGHGSSSGGRRPILYELNADALYIISIGIERTRSRIAVFNLHNQIVGEIQDVWLTMESSEAFLDKLYEHSLQMLEQAGIAYEMTLAVGVGLPGLVNSKTGRSFTFFNFQDNTIQEYLAEKFKLPVFVENDSQTQAVGEFKFGAGKGYNNMLSLNVGKGIGLGIVLEGKPYGGAMGFSGEVGHIQVAQNGKLCECGKTGCLQTVASTRVIEEEARKQIAWGEATLLQEEAPSSQKVIEAALKGDAFSIEILDGIAGELGKGVAILVHLFNPDIVVINGDIADAGALVRVPVIGKLRKLTFPEYYNYTRIAISELKNNAVIYGAMAIVYEHIFQSA